MRTLSAIWGEAEAVATFDYFKAIWKNGPGVVSDAPDWVVAEIEHELSVWIEGHSSQLVGVHLCSESNLVLGILVSPSAFGGDRSLEDSSQGSFVHVFATDQPDRGRLDVDTVRALFESTYGAPISDGAIRQQRNFMLLDFPFHQELAKDLFIDKDRIEGGFGLEASVQFSDFDVTPTVQNLPAAPQMKLESRPALKGSLSSLLDHRDRETPSQGKAGLPFDQGESYAEVIAGLRERLYGNASPDALLAREHAREEPIPSLRRASTDATAPATDVVTTPDPAPANAKAESPTEKLDVGIDESIQRLEPIGGYIARRTWSPLYAIAVLAIVVLLLAGVVVPRFLEPASVEPNLEDAEAAALPTPEDPTRLALPDLTDSNGHSTAELATEIDALDVDAPALQPIAPAPVVVSVLPKVASTDVKPDPLSIGVTLPPAIESVEADSPAQSEVSTAKVAMTQQTPAVGVSEATSTIDVDPSFDVVVASLLEPAQLEQSSEVLDESEATGSGNEPAASSTTTEVGVTPTTTQRETKPRVGRTGRERKRVIGQINRSR